MAKNLIEEAKNNLKPRIAAKVIEQYRLFKRRCFDLDALNIKVPVEHRKELSKNWTNRKISGSGLSDDYIKIKYHLAMDLTNFNLSREQRRGQGLSRERVTEYLLHGPMPVNGEGGSMITVDHNNSVRSGNNRIASVIIGVMLGIVPPEYMIPIIYLKTTDQRRLSMLWLGSNRTTNNKGILRAALKNDKIAISKNVFHPIIKAYEKNKSLASLKVGRNTMFSDKGFNELVLRIGFFFNKRGQAAVDAFMNDELGENIMDPVLGLNAKSFYRGKNNIDGTGLAWKGNAFDLARAKSNVDLNYDAFINKLAKHFKPVQELGKVALTAGEWPKVKKRDLFPRPIHDVAVIFALNNPINSDNYDFKSRASYTKAYHCLSGANFAGRIGGSEEKADAFKEDLIGYTQRYTSVYRQIAKTLTNDINAVGTLDMITRDGEEDSE